MLGEAFPITAFEENDVKSLMTGWLTNFAIVGVLIASGLGNILYSALSTKLPEARAATDVIILDMNVGLLFDKYGMKPSLAALVRQVRATNPNVVLCGFLHLSGCHWVGWRVAPAHRLVEVFESYDGMCAHATRHQVQVRVQ